MGEAFVSARPRVKVKGEVRPDLNDALRSLLVSRPQNGMAHGELQLVYWGAADDARQPEYRFTDIALGDRVEIAFGEDPEVVVFDGEITAVEERYGAGAPQLVFLVQDGLHHLARTRHSRTFDDQSADDIVTAIASDAGLSGDANVSTVARTWHQINESDLAFLLRVLGPFGIALRLDSGNLRARPEERDPEPVALDSSNNALSVRLVADLNHQPVETGVMGFDAASDEEVTGSVASTTDTAEGSTAADLLGTLGWSGTEQVPQPFASGQGLADAFAQGHFDRRARAFVSGEIRCIGDPRLVGGVQVDLAGVSPRVAGLYRVVHCVHRFDAADGYRTHLRVSRADWGAQ